MIESHPTFESSPTAAGPAPIAARILWPALGFPAVIAPGVGAGPASAPDVRRSLCVLVLTDRATLTAADAANFLRIVPWKQRTRRHIPAGQPGSFSAADLHVRSDSPGSPLARPVKDDRADALRFGADSLDRGIAVSLARSVRDFYRKGLPHLHEIRVAEDACRRLADSDPPEHQYHVFWNGRPGAEDLPSDEMQYLLDKFARPTREAMMMNDPDLADEHYLNSLVDEYRFDYGSLHPPYQRLDPKHRYTEILHPVFVWPQSASLTIGHITDAHVNTRSDVYERNLEAQYGPGQPLHYEGRPFFFNNFNSSFRELYETLKHDKVDPVDAILMTGDLIDYGRGHAGPLPGAEQTLGQDWMYLPDRNWFLFYYLLASGDRYTKPVYTGLGNHDWRLNPYPPEATGAPAPEVFIHNDQDNYRPGDQGYDPHVHLSDATLTKLLRCAHGDGWDAFQAYPLPASEQKRTGDRLWRGIAAVTLTGDFDYLDSPVNTDVRSVLWYLMLINPFLDYACPLPGGHQVLMLDWAQKEEFYNAEAPKTRMEFTQRAANCLSPLQKWHVEQFAQSPGRAKVIGIHAPPLGPYEKWSDPELRVGKKTYGRTHHLPMLKPDLTRINVVEHSLCAVAPKNDPVAIAAVYGSFVQNRDWFIRKVGDTASGIRLVLSGHIHRGGLLAAYPPTDDRNARLLAAFDYSAVQGATATRRLVPGVAASRLVDAKKKIERAYPGPLYINTTSAGPRGNRYPGGDVHQQAPPGAMIVRLSAEGTIERVTPRQVPDLPTAKPAQAHEAAVLADAADDRLSPSAIGSPSQRSFVTT